MFSRVYDLKTNGEKAQIFLDKHKGEIMKTGWWNNNSDDHQGRWLINSFIHYIKLWVLWWAYVAIAYLNLLSVDHFLFRCLKWSSFRGEICRLARRQWRDISYLLGDWSGEQKDEILASWKPINEMITAIINFAIAMGWLKNKKAERDESDSSDNE